MKTYKAVVLDSCFISRFHKIKACEYIQFYDEAGDLFFSEEQYKRGSCNYSCLLATDIENNYSDFDIIHFHFNYPGTLKLSQVFPRAGFDKTDFKILIHASQNRPSLICTADKGVLRIATDLRIDRMCFKAGVFYLDDLGNGILLEGRLKEIQDLLLSKIDDPFESMHIMNCDKICAKSNFPCYMWTVKDGETKYDTNMSKLK